MNGIYLVFDIKIKKNFKKKGEKKEETRHQVWRDLSLAFYVISII